MIWRVLGAFALLGAVAAPASAVAPPGARWMITHDGDRMAAVPMHDVAAPDRIEGKVLAIDPQHGSFVLATDAGAIALHAGPGDLAELQVGQTLEVEIVDDTSPDDLAALQPSDR
jgi:hypothetical protein